MFLRDNPVLTRELLVTLRSPRAFVLQLLYVSVLGALVYFYWPAGEDGARHVSPGVARRLFDIFFLGQFFLVSLMAPTFAAGSIQEIQQQIRSHRVLKVRLLDETTDRAAAILRDDPSIRLVETYDHTVSAEFEGCDDDMARLLGRLIQSGITVQSFAEEPLSLEEVFMMITKGIVS